MRPTPSWLSEVPLAGPSARQGGAGAQPAAPQASPPAAGAQLGAPGRRRRWLLAGLLAVWGPGLIVMLADGDAGCLITAAQSGAQWGYRLILPQLLLIPVLYLVQEMTARLGILTGKGHGELIRERFGRGWAVLSVCPMIVSAVGTLVVEFVGITGVGELFGVSRWVTVPVATAGLIALGLSHGYRRIERIGIVVGLAELAFVPAMLLAHPHLGQVAGQLGSQPLGQGSYVTLLAATVGAVIMPWMIFYQQGAVTDKGLTRSNLRQARRDTLAGAVLTQVIMISVIVAMAATVGRTHPNTPLSNVGQIAGALKPFLGANQSRVLVGAAILGGALVSALVVSVAGAWGLAEVFGWRRSLNHKPSRDNAKFYLTYAAAHVAGAILVLASASLISLAIDVEVMNALLLPLVLGFLLALEAKALPPEDRMRGGRRIVVTTVCVIVMLFGLYMIVPVLGL
jgi:Mn2+/Fe2+ NRAMP family transporter